MTFIFHTFHFRDNSDTNLIWEVNFIKKKNLSKIIRNYCDSFEKHKYDVCKINIEPQCVLLKYELTKYLRLYRTPPSEKKEINNQIQYLLTTGLTKRSNSPCSTHVT